MSEVASQLEAALWRLAHRAGRPVPWAEGGNLPWHEPDFSARMLREHLDDAHGAASRPAAERQQQLDWLWEQMRLAPGRRVLDLTCGPGLYALPLAQRGCQVTGVDFGPASIAYARAQAATAGWVDRCQYLEQDVRRLKLDEASFDAALLLYGQLAVFTVAEAEAILATAAAALRPGGSLCLELLDPDRVDRTDSRWWFTDDQGLWGDRPFLHLGERFWYEAEQLSLERYQILHLETGRLDVIHLCDQVYTLDRMTAMLQAAGFDRVDVRPAWAGLKLKDAAEWLVYLAWKEEKIQV